MTGGGFGGSAIALVRHDEAPAIATAVTEVFAGRGWSAPQVLEAVPSGPAARVG
jgi:galactokinase